MGDVLVFAEYQHEHFPKSTLVAINAGLEMARKRGAQCTVVVMGENVDALAQTAAKYGAAKALRCGCNRYGATPDRSGTAQGSNRRGMGQSGEPYFL